MHLLDLSMAPCSLNVVTVVSRSDSELQVPYCGKGPPCCVDYKGVEGVIKHRESIEILFPQIYPHNRYEENVHLKGAIWTLVKL